MAPHFTQHHPEKKNPRSETARVSLSTCLTAETAKHALHSCPQSRRCPRRLSRSRSRRRCPRLPPRHLPPSRSRGAGAGAGRCRARSPERSVQPRPAGTCARRAGKYHLLQRGEGGGGRWQTPGATEMPSLSFMLKYQGRAGGIKQTSHLTQPLRQNQRRFLSRPFPRNGSFQPLAPWHGGAVLAVRALMAGRAVPAVALSGWSSANVAGSKHVSEWRGRLPSGQSWLLSERGGGVPSDGLCVLDGKVTVNKQK